MTPLSNTPSPQAPKSILSKKQPITAIQKNVGFNDTVTVIFIPPKSVYKDAELSPEIWGNKKDFKKNKSQYESDLIKFIQKNPEQYLHLADTSQLIYSLKIPPKKVLSDMTEHEINKINWQDVQKELTANKVSLRSTPAILSSSSRLDDINVDITTTSQKVSTLSLSTFILPEKITNASFLAPSPTSINTRLTPTIPEASY